jgi:hypothetical protein
MAVTHLIALPQELQRARNRHKANFFLRDLERAMGPEKKGQIKFPPLLSRTIEARYELSGKKESCNSRRSFAFDWLRLSFFLLLKILV